jgi:hypothetical protein
MIKVYIKINEENYITEITSSIFLTDTEGWVKIDEGECGDKYAHAQGNYLDKPIMDAHGRYNYKFIDGEVVEIPEKNKREIELVEPQSNDVEARLKAIEEELDALLGV